MPLLPQNITFYLGVRREETSTNGARPRQRLSLWYKGDVKETQGVCDYCDWENWEADHRGRDFQAGSGRMNEILTDKEEYSKCNSLHLLTPNSQPIPLPPPDPWQTTSLLSMSVTPFLFCREIHWYPYFRFHRISNQVLL